MDVFDPFLYDPKIQKKEEFEPEPLYIELGPPPPPTKEEKEQDDAPRIIIIEIL